MRRVRDELGDLLFQVVFHAQLASERGAYDFDAVAAGIAAKLERRHPHVFAPDGRDASHWEQIKAGERAARGASWRARRRAAGAAGADARGEARQARRHGRLRLA